MGTIKKHAKQLLQPYAQSPNSIEVVVSAKKLAQIVLRSRALLPKHKRKMISEVQWLISLVDGKYSTRYRSKEVVDLARDHPSSTRKIHHEHVNTRKEITNMMLGQPSEAATILDRVIACVVTQSEHKRLKKSARGWVRYKEAKGAAILVYDMSKTPPKIKKW